MTNPNQKQFVNFQDDYDFAQSVFNPQPIDVDRDGWCMVWDDVFTDYTDVEPDDVNIAEWEDESLPF